VSHSGTIFRDLRGHLAALFAEGGLGEGHAQALAATTLAAVEGAVAIAREAVDLGVRPRGRPGCRPSNTHDDLVPEVAMTKTPGRVEGEGVQAIGRQAEYCADAAAVWRTPPRPNTCCGHRS
jgi:hypothetical protein